MSTYSSNLRIELVSDGTQASTWGNTTNGNLATILEAAIADNIVVTTATTDQALTYLNGPSDTAADNEAVRAILTLDTASGSDFNVYAPPVSKQYIIYNSNTELTATIYNSTVIGNTTAAGLGVTIPPLESVTVWSDGTNFFSQNTALVSPTLYGTPTAPTPELGSDNVLVATTAFVQNEKDALYPVGTVYMNTVNSTDPATLLGFGTWSPVTPPVGFSVYMWERTA